MNSTSNPKRLEQSAWLIATLAVVCVAAILLSRASVVHSARGRQPAPGFSLTDDKGGRVALADLKGKVVLVNFWATWCHGCKEEMPWYIEFADKYRGAGLAIIGISMDADGWNAVRPFIQEKKLNYTVVIGNDALANQYGLDSMPLSVLVDRNGNIAASHAGVVDKDAWEHQIQKLLEEKSNQTAGMN